jgi:PAS domain S-box-containing protein
VPARYSLRWRLPVLIAGLIALVLATFLWAAYRRVEATLVRAAGERAQGASDQIASLLDGHRSDEQLRQLSVDPAFRRFLKLRTDEASEIARARLTTLAGNTPRRVELWDDTGTLLLETVSSAAAPKRLPAGTAPSINDIGIGALSGSPDTAVFSDAIAEVRDDSPATPQTSAGRRLGYVRVRSTFVVNPPGIFNRLVGHDAVVRIGNRTGGTWTDFLSVVPAAAVDLARPGVAQYQLPDGRIRFGAVSLVPSTPWAAWVEFPYADVIAPARGFLSEMIFVTLAFLAVAVVAVTLVVARITKPIAELNTAAMALAAGDYSRRVTAERPDEIGHLGRTFNAMAAEVETTSDALRKSEESYRRLFASNPHAMWVYDAETLRFLDVNDMAMASYGYSRDEFVAMTITDIRPDTELPALLDSVAGRGAGADVSGIWKHRKRDGTVIDAEVSAHDVVLGGRPARVVLAHDVTERLQTQQALQESEALFRGMAETMPHIVWTARPDGRIEYLNGHWFESTGLNLEDTRRDGWRPVLHPADHERTTETHARAFQSGEPFEIAYRLKRTGDGVYRWHIGRAAPLRNDSGAIVMWVGTSTDVDDAKRAAEDLKMLNADLELRVLARTAELEVANQELESFSYSVSHDLRAPLRHVQGYVEMLTAATDGQLSDKSLRYLKTITEATEEMGNLIDDLLAFSRTARIPMSMGRVSLDDLVRDAIAGLEIPVRGRTIAWNIASLPAAIGDPRMLKQVLANLLGNAVKYTRDREHASIEVGCAGEEDGRQVLFVRDNGAGFDTRYAHKLFGVFQRLHRADEFEGTGIGLATVRRIINRHGGRTWAEGKLGEGATFYFTLQASAAVAVAPELVTGAR